MMKVKEILAVGEELEKYFVLIKFCGPHGCGVEMTTDMIAANVQELSLGGEEQMVVIEDSSHKQCSVKMSKLLQELKARGIAVLYHSSKFKDL